jgi:hypothetical protein
MSRWLDRARQLRPIQIGLVALTLLTTLTLAVTLRDAVREYVLLPLLFAGWLLDLLLSTVPQVVLLSLAVLITAGLAGRGLALAFPRIRERGVAAAIKIPESRQTYWHRQIAYAHANPFAAEKLADELRTLTITLLATEHRLSREAVIAQARNRTLALPDDVRQLIDTPQRWGLFPRRPLVERLRVALHLPVHNPTPMPYTAALARVVDFLETQAS